MCCCHQMKNELISFLKCCILSLLMLLFNVLYRIPAFSELGLNVEVCLKSNENNGFFLGGVPDEFNSLC